MQVIEDKTKDIIDDSPVSKKRRLGDEWSSWDGATVAKKVDTPKHIFLLFAFLSVVIVSSVSFLTYYLIEPRLGELSSYLPNIAFAFCSLFSLYLFAYYTILLLSSYTNIKLHYIGKRGFKVISYLLDKVFKIANIFNYNKDYIGNSFVKVSNSFFKGIKNPNNKEKLLILLPRCLTKDTYQKIQKISKDNKVDMAVCSGGEIARKKIKEYRPSAVIGVACERDLVSGIKDVGNKISVLGIPNIRPFGPCKDTHIDFKELERSIQFYLSSKKS